MATSPLIRVIAPNAVRVTHFDPSAEQPADRPWLKDVLLELPTDEKHGVSINVEVTDGLVCARNQQGDIFF